MAYSPTAKERDLCDFLYWQDQMPFRFELDGRHCSIHSKSSDLTLTETWSLNDDLRDYLDDGVGPGNWSWRVFAGRAYVGLDSENDAFAFKLRWL